MKLNKITTMTIETYKRKRIKAGVTIRLNRELVALRALFYRCAELGKYDGENPLKKIELPFKEKDEREEEPRVLTQDEQSSLIEACREPLRTIVLCGLHGGFRGAAELFPLRWRSVNFDERWIRVESNYSKNHRARKVPMNTVLFEVMQEHRERSAKRGPGDYVFLSRHGKPFKYIRTAFENALKRAKIDTSVTVHTLRHTWASELVEAGVDLEAVRCLGGWRSYRMVQRYSHSRQAHLAASVEKLTNRESNTPTLSQPREVKQK